MKKISLVIPVYNEESGFDYFNQQLSPVLNELIARGYTYEIIFVDDGSKDNTGLILRKMASADERIKAVRFVRNYGAHRAIFVGYQCATGDCAINLSIDLQESPRLLLEMISAWDKESLPGVIMVREENKGGTLFFSKIFWSLMKMINTSNTVFEAADVFLLDKAVLKNLVKMDEHNICIDVLILALGYEYKRIPYKREARKFGTSKWNTLKKVKLFFDTLISLSFLPIRIFLSIGFITILISIIYSVFIIINRLFFETHPIEGWTTLVILILFIGGVLILGIGILGEYLWRTLEEVRNRPKNLILETLNLDPSTSEKF